jgi:2-oxoglutarate ferredoxin oxidoreductase subunit gamma
MRVEFRLSGSGGQGLLLAGIVLAEAVILEGKHAAQTQSYGPEARGGASKAEVVVCDEEIDYPKALDPDYLLALTAESYRNYGPGMGKGLIVVDASVALLPEIAARTVSLPILETATEEIGKRVVANMVALGVLGGLAKVAGVEALEAALRSRVPRGTEELNLKALRAGLELAAQANARRDVRRASPSDRSEAILDARNARRGKDDGRYR